MSPAEHAASDVAAPLRPPRAAELVADHLRRQIVKGELREGDRLPPIPELLTEFRVSRPTLRDALSMLEGESLLTVERGARGGARVREPNGDAAAGSAGSLLQFRNATLADVYEARLTIEVPAVRKLATRPPTGAVDRLRAAHHHACAHLEEPATGIRLQEDFHVLMVELAGNRTLTVFAEMINTILAAHRARSTARFSGEPRERKGAHRGTRAHERLLDLIDQGEPDEAERLWTRHLRQAAEYKLRASDTPTVLDLLG